MAAVYKTKSGDTWDQIAREAYGNESYMSFLMANNQELLEYFVFPEGIMVAVPERKKEDSLLPDWRR